ncbi:histidinol-phosphatase [Rhodospirillum rubrum]|uniref:histidinol-phosphatase n=1 Tax=Rhodospirillum rubrum TaxID=1085 RepID=UPI001903D041|nr:histidinol-phosphatase [Rhodospirillum rubrum]MBK1663455.1 histidinol-phosphatase [Rhodospirillum rubrum]MBK1675362.1 histidinol-phosphatase [Rhodospirillum rubrum]
MAPPVDAFVPLVHQLADLSAAIIAPLFRTPLTVDDKDDASPVTAADRDSEAAMREVITRAYPDHGVIGEEHGSERTDAEFVWVLDPIDGTGAFITGKPSFGTLIGLCHNGVPVLGAINQPILNERWIGGQGLGASFNGKTIACRPCPALNRAALYTTAPELFARPGDAEAFERLRRRAKLRRYGCDCYAYGLVALGFADLVVETGLKIYDYAALAPIVTAAGGVMTDWENRPLTLASADRVIASGDLALHREVLAVIAEQTAL